jgi:hypothetical protein
MKKDSATEFDNLWKLAHEAGWASGLKAGGQSLLDALATKEKLSFEIHGPCGFAWITVRPAHTAFAKWLVRKDHATKAQGGGVRISVSYFNQAMHPKEAYARAFAEVLTAGGIDAVALSQID